MKYLIILILFSSCVDKNLVGNDLEFRTAKMTKSQLREDYDFLSDENFKNKLSESLESPLMFYRSFPISYYKDIKLVESAKEGICLGDGHIDNFGFILFEKDTKYLFNDLDDSGLCPLPLDALRYFSSLHFFSLSNDQIQNLISYYIAHLDGTPDVPDMPASLVEDLEKKRLKNLKKHTIDYHFILDDEVIATSNELKTKISEVVVEKFSAVKVYDVATYLKDDGGSGGLNRYWVLVEDQASQFDIIELKQRATPATLFSTTSQTPLELTSLAKNIWGELPVYFEEIELNEKQYQVRSRTKEDINLNKVDADAREAVLKIQVAFMARHHKLYEAQNDRRSSEWFYLNSKLIAKRFLQAFEELKLK
ncbi:MAG: hypothetical protein COW01_04205 [Bdellovibrionales bacterium CG12_big_fil_rev_8_21_14_0_65_38_15]|nr:MAG: hypothetical protein COW79_12730 [Bdellovibrionales bacterium CG22_combo_CG10-13_8_21_14_all_38_13]PIQ56664.1 MAG: hypothetical protein COW01_04205 [Bdellovibrionales bacterium CG12_big_fil_rev_8_21_14_0_65_38_15]PIR31219.1 MAG: hypothetical protein COV38_01285 [Bdellovibrionales bacterium CG11_big_fil_rev_8_21_14_0_20_38_13]